MISVRGWNLSSGEVPLSLAEQMGVLCELTGAPASVKVIPELLRQGFTHVQICSFDADHRSDSLGEWVPLLRLLTTAAYARDYKPLRVLDPRQGPPAT